MMIFSLSFTGAEVVYRHGLLRDIDPECNSTKCKAVEYASIIGVCSYIYDTKRIGFGEPRLVHCIYSIPRQKQHCLLACIIALVTLQLYLHANGAYYSSAEIAQGRLQSLLNFQTMITVGMIQYMSMSIDLIACRRSNSCSSSSSLCAQLYCQ